MPPKIKKASLPITDEEARELGGVLVEKKKKFRCKTGKCQDKTTRPLKNTLGNIKSHICKLHRLDFKGEESSYNRFMKVGLLPKICPTCLRGFKSSSRLDSHRRTAHGYMSSEDPSKAARKAARKTSSKASSKA